AHADFERLFGDRHVREHADPDLAAALHVARHRTARGLELAGSHARTRRRLQTVLAERDSVAALREPGVTAFELLAVLGAFGLHEMVVARSLRPSVPSRALAPARLRLRPAPSPGRACGTLRP